MSSSFCHITAAASSESEPSDTHGETSTTRKDSRQQQAAYLCNAYNQCPPDDHTERYQILSKMLKCPSSVQIEPVFSVRNGSHCTIGKGTFINHNVTFIDTQTIVLGNQVLIGPNTVITTMASQPGAKDKPVHIGHRVWIGANVTITAGVTIGDNAVIGAGSVVESDIPANAIAVGQPARVIRKIQQNTQ